MKIKSINELHTQDIQGLAITLNLILLVLMLVIFGIAADKYNQRKAMYLLESECIQEYVEIGIKRSNIRTAHGKCWIENKGYYNGYGE